MGYLLPSICLCLFGLYTIQAAPSTCKEENAAVTFLSESLKFFKKCQPLSQENCFFIHEAIEKCPCVCSKRMAGTDPDGVTPPGADYDSERIAAIEAAQADYEAEKAAEEAAAAAAEAAEDAAAQAEADAEEAAAKAAAKEAREQKKADEAAAAQAALDAEPQYSYDEDFILCKADHWLGAEVCKYTDTECEDACKAYAPGLECGPSLDYFCEPRAGVVECHCSYLSMEAAPGDEDSADDDDRKVDLYEPSDADDEDTDTPSEGQFGNGNGNGNGDGDGDYYTGNGGGNDVNGQNPDDYELNNGDGSGVEASAAPAAGLCFESGSMVQTNQGPMTMQQLGAHDLTQKNIKLLAYDAVNGESVWSPLVMWGHMDAQVEAEFLHLTAGDRHISVTGNHVIYRSANCDPTQLETVLAQAVRVGECLLNVQDMSMSRVTQISGVVSRGIYSPITQEGTVVVDGFAASCFANNANQWLQQTFFNVLRPILSMFDQSLVSNPQPSMIYLAIDRLQNVFLTS